MDMAVYRIGLMALSSCGGEAWCITHIKGSKKCIVNKIAGEMDQVQTALITSFFI